MSGMNTWPVLASGNKRKLKEIRSLLGKKIGWVRLTGVPEIQSSTVEEVSKAKGLCAWEILRRPLIVDDTSLLLEGWGGMPGPFVKYFVDSPGGLMKIAYMSKLDDLRRATMQCCLTYVNDGRAYSFHGEVKGTISYFPRGKRIFGIDRIFVPGNGELTFAEMSPAEKNVLSARAMAVKGLRKYLESL